MVFAAGLGTRLRPLTDRIPKALVPIGGKPLLGLLLGKLKESGFDEVVVNVHHLADQVVSYLRTDPGLGVRAAISDERERLLETGGAILKARELLGEGPFLVHNVDILSNLDFGWLVSNSVPDALANLVVSERETQRYFLFDEGMRLRGWTNLATGEVRSPFPDLDPSACRKYAFAGIHLVSGGIFKVFDQDGWKDRFSITDFYISECAKHPIHGVLPPGLRMMDVGKVSSLEEAQRFLGEREDEVR